MKIAITSYGHNNDIDCLSKWIQCYDKYACDYKCVLIYKDTQQDLLDMWPYEKIEFPYQLDINHSNESYSNIFSKSNICEIMKLYSYDIVGDCIALDYDAFFRKKITNNLIPACNWGMCRYTKYSNYFVHENIIHQNLVNYKELDISSWCNCGVQIMRKNYTDLFWGLFQEYLKDMDKIQYIQNYSADILCLAHKISNGVYLQPEWNWYPLSSVPNNNVIIYHYYGKKAKGLISKL